MSRRPRHTANDGSFGRSTGIQAGRGAVLLIVAAVLCIVMLKATDDSSSEVNAAGGTTTTTEHTTTSVAPTTTIVTVPPRPPADVKVIAGNATDVKGVARQATDELKAAGYNVLSPTDAKNKKIPASAVYFVGDYSREAAAVATALGLPVTVVATVPTPGPVADTRGANVIVLVGPELAQRLAATAPSTTTTAARASTTTTRASTTSTTKATTTTTKP
ncbi:MAG TPA: LytR C-terminal domain-containing protein [Acidimicrobiales bacterium]|nr:LytR C-terminal domain-containing protein [Acidimicrobiales bacterium]